jgi:hypothetical protein
MFIRVLEEYNRIVGYRPMLKFDEPCWLKLAMNGIRWIQSFNSLKPQNLKQKMNIIDTLSHASKLKKMMIHRHSTKNQFSTIQNSCGRLEGWGGDDSLHWMFMGWHVSSKL